MGVPHWCYRPHQPSRHRVQMSCHPELNQYIQDTLHCVKPLLEKVRPPAPQPTSFPIWDGVMLGPGALARGWFYEWGLPGRVLGSHVCFSGPPPSSAWAWPIRVSSSYLVLLSETSWSLSPQPVPLMSGNAYLTFSDVSLGFWGPSASRLSRAMSVPFPFLGQGGGGGGWGIHFWSRVFLSLQNDVEKVVVVILDKEHRPVEKFVFEITQPPLLSIR